MITFGEGRTQVWLKVQEVDEDIVITVGGGERSHIGGVVLKVPDEEIRTLPIGNHRDLEVLVPIAEAAFEKYGKTVVVVGGIHIDNASIEEIKEIITNCNQLKLKLINENFSL